MTQYRNVSVGGIKASQLSAFPRTVHRIEADGVRVFYRAAGDTTAPVVLLLHGFPTSSFMFRELIPRLADHHRVIAPDLPGFGFTEVPAERRYVYSFDGLAATIKAFTEELTISRFAVTFSTTARHASAWRWPSPTESQLSSRRTAMPTRRSSGRSGSR
jgi:hypothetical protein